MWPVSQKTVIVYFPFFTVHWNWLSTDALKLQVYRANLDDEVIKESQESMVTLEPLVPQARPVLYVTFMDLQALQDLQETLD